MAWLNSVSLVFDCILKKKRGDHLVSALLYVVIVKLLNRFYRVLRKYLNHKVLRK